LPKLTIAGSAAAALAAIVISLAFALGAFDRGEANRSDEAGASDASAPETPPSVDTTDDPPPPEVTPVILGSGSAGGFSYREPVPLVPGRYESPLASREAEAWSRGMAAASAENGKPQFEGAINGFRLWSSEHAITDDSVRKVICGGEDFAEWRLVEKLKFTYLPPGTAAETPQQEVLCPDGSVAGAGQHFIVRDGPVFAIWYESGERAFQNVAPAARVAAGEVQGRAAVIIKPVTEEGFGVSWIAFATDNGFIWLHAFDLPLEEALKIAEGARCESC
jgi:hypothetical protein